LPASRQSSIHFEQISLDIEREDGHVDATLTRASLDEATPHSRGSQERTDDPENGNELTEAAGRRRSTSPELQGVVIDASQPHPVAIEIQVAPTSTSQSSTHGSALSPTSSRHSGLDYLSPVADLPSTSRAKSTSDLPLPPQSAPSLGRPSSSHHKPSKSQGPSIFEQVVSKTRPSFLPPKKKDEDVKHMQDWEQMMKRSRAAGKIL